MTKFKYRAKNNRGDIVGGVVRAANVLAAEKILRDNGLAAVDISPESRSFTSLFGLIKKVSLKDRAIFASQLSTMISAGLALPRCLNIIAAQTDNQYLKTVYYNVSRDLEEGTNFSVALDKHPEVFDRLFVSVVHSGESTGNLDTVLLGLSKKLENDQNISGKLLAALVYPSFIILALIVVSWIMLVKIVPQIESVFKDANVDLPWATSVLIATSHFLIVYWWLVIILLISLVIFVRYYFRTKNGEDLYSKLQLKIPGLRRIVSDIYMARFCRTIEMLFSSGVSILEAIETTADTMINSYYKSSLQRVAKEVQKGVSFSVELSKDPLFPPLVSQMLSVGEQTGKSAEVMDKLARYYEAEADVAIKSIYSLVEPLAMIIVGIGVAVLVFAIMVPIYQIALMQ